MIISGYPGIGKSSMAESFDEVIDLESHNMVVDGTRHDDWAKAYCNFARDFSNHCKTVFVSSHKEVRDELKDYECKLLVYPSISMKNSWIKKLEKRYDEFPSEKNRKALEFGKKYFESSILELQNDTNFKYKLELTNPRYNLMLELCDYYEKYMAVTYGHDRHGVIRLHYNYRKSFR